LLNEEERRVIYQEKIALVSKISYVFSCPIEWGSVEES
jgi:hypothetical protein